MPLKSPFTRQKAPYPNKQSNYSDNPNNLNNPNFSNTPNFRHLRIKEAKEGTMLKGKRMSDGEPCKATFVKVRVLGA